MSSRIKLVRGDTRPDLTITLSDATTGGALDLTTASAVNMKFRAEGTTDTLSTISCSITSPTNGRCSLSWPVGALDVDPGYYEGEIVVSFADGTSQTVYDVTKFVVRADF